VARRHVGKFPGVGLEIVNWPSPVGLFPIDAGIPQCFIYGTLASGFFLAYTRQRDRARWTAASGGRLCFFGVVLYL
jgi:hypothetical protein